MKRTVFIQTNARQILAAKVAAHAIRSRSSHPDTFEVRVLRLEEFPALYGREGQPYLREGRVAAWKNDDLQSFTPLRFLPPQLMAYEGKAVVIDPDVFALCDIVELFELPMGDASILCRRIVPEDGRTPYYASSVMVLDCAKLRHWRWEECLDEMFAMKRDYRAWMSLYLEPEASIGRIEEKWNSFDKLTAETKLLHNTSRITQPWKTGLPVDFFVDRKPASKPSFRKGVKRFAKAVTRILTGGEWQPGQSYRAHPDPRQEQLFFSLLDEAIMSGVISREFLHEQISKRHLRGDALLLLDAAKGGT